MKKIIGAVLTCVLLGAVSGCSSIQEEYKPLYQVKPEKEAAQ